MKKSCVIFSCTILSEDRLSALHEFLTEFKKDFFDCDFFIGINPHSVLSVEEVIRDYRLNIVSISRAAHELYSNSDASAYQIALKCLRDSGNQYETCWFVHTKGAVNNHSDYLRTWYINNFLSNKLNVEQFLSENKGIGSYGMLSLAYDFNKVYQEKDTEIQLFQNVITKELPYTHAHFFYIHSIYAIKGHIVDSFFRLINDSWFVTKLDRYYFEGIFPFIVSRLGYFPYVSNGLDMDGKSLPLLNNAWLTDNNLLNKHSEYIHLHKTNYNFNQLNPPYVNSNTQS